MTAQPATKPTYEAAMAHPRRLTTCDYGIEHTAAKRYLTCLGCPWGNSFGIWGGDAEAWSLFDAEVREKRRNLRWY